MTDIPVIENLSLNRCVVYRDSARVVFHNGGIGKSYIRVAVIKLKLQRLSPRRSSLDPLTPPR